MRKKSFRSQVDAFSFLLVCGLWSLVCGLPSPALADTFPRYMRLTVDGVTHNGNLVEFVGGTFTNLGDGTLRYTPPAGTGSSFNPTNFPLSVFQNDAGFRTTDSNAVLAVGSGCTIVPTTNGTVVTYTLTVPQSGTDSNTVNALIASGTALNASNWLGWASASNWLHTAFYPLGSNPSNYLAAIDWTANPSNSVLQGSINAKADTNGTYTLMSCGTATYAGTAGAYTGSITFPQLPTGSATNITGGGTWSLSNGAYTFTPTGITAAAQSALDGKLATNGVAQSSVTASNLVSGAQVNTMTITNLTTEGSQTMNGTANLAPNQTASSASSLLTRGLGDARYTQANHTGNITINGLLSLFNTPTNSLVVGYDSSNYMALRVGSSGAGTLTLNGTTADITVVQPNARTTLLLRSTATSGTTAGGGLIAGSYDGAALASGDRLGFFLFGGFDGAADRNAAGVFAYAGGAWSSGVFPADLVFETTATGSRTEKMRLTGAGTLTVTGTINAPKVSVGTNTNYFTVVDGTNLVWVAGTTTQKVTLGTYP